MNIVTYRSVHPLHAVMLAGTLPLFLGVLLSDYAYFQSYEVQWKNFASWLIVGGLFFCGIALLAALLERRRAAWRTAKQVIYLCVLIAAWLLGLINAFVHAADAWASMPQGLVLSMITAVLVLAAVWLRMFDTQAESAR